MIINVDEDHKNADWLKPGKNIRDQDMNNAQISMPSTDGEKPQERDQQHSG